MHPQLISLVLGRHWVKGSVIVVTITSFLLILCLHSMECNILKIVYFQAPSGHLNTESSSSQDSLERLRAELDSDLACVKAVVEEVVVVVAVLVWPVILVHLTV